MHTLFVVCFGVGAGFTLLSLLFGEVLNNIDFDVDTDFDFGTGVSPFKPTIIAAFLTVFGGVGLLLFAMFDWYVTFVLAAVLGLFIAFLIFRFVYVPLSRAQNTSAVEIQSLVGMNATVTEKIMQGGFGKITYFVNGNTYTAPAKSETGTPIDRKQPVEIVYIEKNIYYVRQK